MLDLLRALARGLPSGPVQRVYRIPAPASATDLTVTVPGQYLWLPIALRGAFTVANSGSARVATLEVTDGSDVVADVTSATTVPINGATSLSWVSGLTVAATDATAKVTTLPLPAIPLLAGWTIGTKIGGLATGDALASVRLTVVELFTGEVEAVRDIEGHVADRLHAIAELANLGDF